MNNVLLAFLIVITFILPTKSNKSPVGIILCSWEYWVIWTSFLLGCFICLCIAVRLVTWQ